MLGFPGFILFSLWPLLFFYLLAAYLSTVGDLFNTFLVFQALSRSVRALEFSDCRPKASLRSALGCILPAFQAGMSEARPVFSNVFELAKSYFAMQSDAMETNWAEEHLQTIRTLMERSAVYRRALAPIMLFAGSLGIIGAVIGVCFHLETMRQFTTMWLVVAVLTAGGVVLIARRQAFKDSEPFWSPPTRRIMQALAPPFTVGLVLGLVAGLEDAHDLFYALIVLWAFFYGCAVHSAGFFISRGMRLFGWVFIGCVIVVVFYHIEFGLRVNPHYLMGFFFGVLHLACGAYLFLTEKGKNAA